MRALVAIVLWFGNSGRVLAGPDPEVPHAFEAGWQGQAVCEVLEETDELRMARCSFAPGIGHELHYHNPHTGYALTAGRMRITDPDGERVVDIPAGTTWSNDTPSLHEVVNVGDTTAVYLIIEPRPQSQSQIEEPQADTP